MGQRYGQVIILEDKMRKAREERTYRETKSKDGTFSPILNKQISQRINRYCEAKNINRTVFVTEVLSERLNFLEREMLMEKSKEELVEIILTR